MAQIEDNRPVDGCHGGCLHPEEDQLVAQKGRFFYPTLLHQAAARNTGTLGHTEPRNPKRNSHRNTRPTSHWSGKKRNWMARPKLNFEHQAPSLNRIGHVASCTLWLTTCPLVLCWHINQATKYFIRFFFSFCPVQVGRMFFFTTFSTECCLCKFISLIVVVWFIAG